MKHVREVSRMRVREAQGPVEILSLIGSLLTILSTMIGVILPLTGAK